jgi:hypothetical protein
MHHIAPLQNAFRPDASQSQLHRRRAQTQQFSAIAPVATRRLLTLGYDPLKALDQKKFRVAPSADTSVFNPGLLNCANPECQNKRSLQQSRCKTGFACQLCGQFYDDPEFAPVQHFDLEHDDSPSLDKAQAKLKSCNYELQCESSRLARIQKHVDIKFDKQHNQRELRKQREHLRAQQALHHLFQNEHRAPQYEFEKPRPRPSGKLQTMLIPSSMLECSQTAQAAPALKQHAQTIIQEYIERNSTRTNNYHSLARAAVVLSSREHKEAAPVTFKNLASMCKINNTKIDITQSAKRYGKKLQQTLKLPETTLEQSVREQLGLFQARIQRPALCEAYRKRIQSQLELLLEQLETPRSDQDAQLQRRKPATLAAGVICCALWKMPIVHNGKRQLVSAQFVVNLTKVSHERVQMVFKNAKRLEFGQ